MSDENLESAKGEEQLPPSESAPAPIESPGKMLAAKRLELNWSVEDVAHSLHLAPRQIHAIEADNYGALPGLAVTRGFVRSYAKLLKLDPAPLLEKIGTESSDRKSDDISVRKALPAKPFYAHRSASLGGKSRSRAWVVVLAIIIVSTAALLIAWKSDWLPSTWMTEAKGLLPGLAESGETRRSQPNPGFALEASAPTPAPVDSQIQSSENAQANVPEPQMLRASETQAAAPADAVFARNPGAPEQKDTLVLKLREDSWIEIRDARNKILLSRLAKAGESEAIPVSEPLKLVIGNAAGVDLQLRGVPVELNASARSNVARLTVN